MDATQGPAEFIGATEFIDRLEQLRVAASVGGSEDESPRIPYREVFALARQFIDAPPDEIERILEHDDHQTRVGAVSIMDFQARRRSTSLDRRRALYELYVRRHDRIDDWDLVDRAAPWVVGGYLADKPRDQLYTFAHSANVWERRTAIVATYHFIRRDDLDDTFAIAEILIDAAELVQKAVGGFLREAGKHDVERLTAFLDRHAATMNRTALRYAIKHFDPETRQRYLARRAAERATRDRVGLRPLRIHSE